MCCNFLYLKRYWQRLELENLITLEIFSVFLTLQLICSGRLSIWPSIPRHWNVSSTTWMGGTGRPTSLPVSQSAVSSLPLLCPPMLTGTSSTVLTRPRINATRSPFHQPSMSSFYARRSQKRKKDCQVKQLYCAFGICARKSCSYNLGEIDPCSRW